MSDYTITDLPRHMAVIELHREQCPRCNFGEFYRNEIMCRTCSRDCPYSPTAYPTEKEIERAKIAIKNALY